MVRFENDPDFEKNGTPLNENQSMKNGKNFFKSNNSGLQKENG